MINQPISDKPQVIALLLLAVVPLLLMPGKKASAHPPRFHVLAIYEQKLTGDAEENGKDADFVYDKPNALVPARVLEKPSWYDATLAAREDSIWYAWLEFSPGLGDQLWVGQRQDGDWLWREPVLETQGDFAAPRLTITADGRFWLSYEAAPKDKPWDIWLVEIVKGKKDRQPLRISPGSGSDINHRVAADPTGGLWFAWQTDNGGQFDVVVRHAKDQELEPVISLSKAAQGDWHPSVACAKDGTAHVVWDSYDGESYDVLWSKIDSAGAGSVVKVAATPATECRAQVVVDPADRVWIAWEEGGPNWGAPYRPKLSTTAMNDQLGPLHRFRYLRLAEGLPDGTIRKKYEVPMPAHVLAPKRSGLTPGATGIGAFYERARLAIDGRGRLWIAYRHFYTPWLGVEHRNHVQAGWGVYARCLTEQGWSDLFRFAGVQGDGMQSLELSPQADGIAAVWTTGRTQRDNNKLPRGIVIGSVSTMAGDPVSKQSATDMQESNLQTASQSLIAARLVSKTDRGSRPKVELDGESYELFFGDLHRHTDLSLCRVPVDGTIDDTYRYAIDAAGLDFLGITDHSRDIAKGDHLSQLWWRSRKEVERHRLGSAFIPFYSYERSHSPTADHNIISLKDNMLRPHTYSVFKFMKELDPATTIAIPHQPVRRDTWLMQDDARRPLVEMYQGCRDASIEEDVHRGLAKGYKLGIIASSDHMSTSASYACVWAKEPTREAIFQAMRDRRTYGATSRIQLSVKAGDHWMGEVTSLETLPPLEVMAEAEAPIRSVNFIIDGVIRKTVSPNTASLKLKQSIEMAGAHYVYVHLLLADGNHAWSSPIWVQPKAAK